MNSLPTARRRKRRSARKTYKPKHTHAHTRTGRRGAGRRRGGGAPRLDGGVKVERRGELERPLGIQAAGVEDVRGFRLTHKGVNLLVI